MDDENKRDKASISMFQVLQKEIKDLKTELKNKEDKTIDKDFDVVENNKVNLRQYEDKIVIGYDKERGTWQAYDKIRREDKLMIELLLLDNKGKETKKVVDYIDFLNNTKVIAVELERVKSKEVIENKGIIRIKEVIDFKTVATKDKIMQKVISRKDTAVVKMPNGETRELDIDFINL